ncbi:hypothetical protein PR001_g1599 [Phytophthora rubi]|uniref:SAP domain-containing protein n=2 Tax=Phytophthora rubi TaxID=129364 RepID=A0A6A3PAZ1_9STRA|nr:hypothetical protein PR001_g1599 [Phytophthora rubi]
MFNLAIKSSGAVVPPTNDDYASWTVMQLRKECTERKLRLSRKVPKAEQIRRLRDYDAMQRAVQATVDEENVLGPSLRKTKYCIIRHLNIIFADRIAERLASSDDAATRDQIDAGEVNHKTAFWREVAAEFLSNTTDFNNLFDLASNDPRFHGINPSVIVGHGVARLYGMWKKVYRNYAKAYAKFYVPGQNSDDFYDYCDSSLDAAYLRVCTKVKSELEAFVNGGMHAEDEVDSMNLNKEPVRPQSNRSSRWQDQVVNTVSRLADCIVGSSTTVAAPSTASNVNGTEDESVLLDRITKLHHLIDQVQESIRREEANGNTASALEESLGLYQRRLQRLQTQLTDLD